MGIIDLFFPKNCLNCKKPEAYICGSCIEKLPKVVNTCPICARASVDGFTHAKCTKPLGLDGLTCFWPYSGVIRVATISLKFKFAREVGKELRSYCLKKIDQYKGILPKDAVLVPIPLYWYKENLRGFNQAGFVGEYLSKKVGWKFCGDLLIKKKLSRPQTELKGGERINNVRGVFTLNPNYRFSHTNYILFDDVYTTGSTLKEACKVLKTNLRRQGNRAEKVWGLTIAR
jgi:ComF family protein